MQRLWNALGVPSTKIPVDGVTFVSYVVPPVVGYFLLAVLAITPDTRTLRLALWPLIALLALRSMLSVDMSHSNPEYTIFDTVFVLFMYTGAIRSFSWTLVEGPLVRHLHPKNSSPSIIMDALDLTLTFRGFGWDWSRRLHVPRETRPTNRASFVLYTFLSAIVHAFVCGVFHRAVLTLVPESVGSISKGSTLFDSTLPLALRYLRSSIITAFTGIAIYAGMQTVYGACTILGILVFGQDPAQWPPAFDAPWRATSLGDFWGRRWHQFSRHVFLLSGGYPFALVLGRAGVVIGTFLASGLWHHIQLLALDREADVRWQLIGFGMMGPGVLAERAFHRLTGRPVSGVVGWFWTVTWLLVGGNLIFEGFSKAPMHDRSTLIDGVPFVGTLVERLVMGFDGWLHAI